MLDDSYRVDMVFMDKVIASVTFSMGEEAERKDGEDTNCLSTQQPWQTSNRVEEENLKEPLQALNELIGLGAIKQQINEHIDYLKLLKL